MKKLWIFCCLLLMVQQASAQEVLDNQLPDSKGTVSGHIMDAAGHGLEFANVVVFLNTGDSTKGTNGLQLLKGMMTDSSGAFALDALPVETTLQLRATSLGFATLNKEFRIPAAQPALSLGNLQMPKDKTQLAEVTVTTTKPFMTMDMDKKVYNTSRDIVSIGGTGLDVVKNVPGINVDVDGNVSMRGKSPQLFIDGKPTILTLDQVPANTIETVEIISNPSAKYDASGGGAGILNVVLKKNRKTGYNGNLRAGVDSHEGINGGGTINYKTEKFNVSADVNARSAPDYTKGSINRQDFSTDPTVNLNQEQWDTANNKMIFAKLGLDYYLSKRTTLSASLFAMHHGSETTSDINILADSIYSAGGSVSSRSYENIFNKRSFNGRGVTLGFKHDFKKEKESWTADFNYFSGNADSKSQYQTDNYSDVSGSNIASSTLQKIEGGGSDYNIIIQSDYTNPLTKAMTLEAGVRGAFQGRKNNNSNFVYDDATAGYVLIPTAASNYKSQNNVLAAYGTLSGNVGKYSYKAGLRVESSGYNGTLLNSNETFSNHFPLSLFPSLFIGRNLSDGQDIQLSYSRRVNRPNFFQLIPYTDSSNSLNITRGNPNLIPEFTQSLELSYLRKLFSKGTFMGTLYYKYTSNLITGYIETDIDAAGNSTFINTYINASSSYSTGAEFTAQYAVNKWWDFNANVNIYKSKINLDAATSSSSVQQDNFLTWFGKMNMNFRLPAGFSAQLTGTYQSKSNLPVSTGNNQPGPPDRQSSAAAQGYISPYYFVDLAIKKDFYQGKLVASLSFNDIFKSRNQKQYTYSDYFTQHYSRLRNPQMLRLNFSYNFGNLETKHFDKKNNNVQMEE